MPCADTDKNEVLQVHSKYIFLKSFPCWSTWPRLRICKTFPRASPQESGDAALTDPWLSHVLPRAAGFVTHLATSLLCKKARSDSFQILTWRWVHAKVFL